MLLNNRWLAFRLDPVIGIGLPVDGVVEDGVSLIGKSENQKEKMNQLIFEQKTPQKREKTAKTL